MPSPKVRTISAGLILLFAVSTMPLNARADISWKALVIGNADYRKGALQNPVRDARLVALHLQRAGHLVTVATNLTSDRLEAAVTQFGRGLEPEDAIVIYYAGHGMELKGANYLMGVEFDAQQAAFGIRQSVAVSEILEALEVAQTRLVILDACRDNPFTRSWARSGRARGFQREIDLPSATYVVFATQPGAVASDGPGAPNGPFALAFVRHLQTKNLELDSMFRRVRSDVIRATGGSQVPWTNHNLTSLLFLVGPRTRGGKSASAPPVAVPPRALVSTETYGPSESLVGIWDTEIDTKRLALPGGQRLRRRLRFPLTIEFKKDGRQFTGSFEGSRQMACSQGTIARLRTDSENPMVFRWKLACTSRKCTGESMTLDGTLDKRGTLKAEIKPTRLPPAGSCSLLYGTMLGTKE